MHLVHAGHEAANADKRKYNAIQQRKQHNRFSTQHGKAPYLKETP
jgi:hypothetical protein